MTAGTYPKYQLPSGGWTPDKEHADKLWLRHNSGYPGPGCQVTGKCPQHPAAPGRRFFEGPQVLLCGGRAT
jgi:hypothetical protein